MLQASGANAGLLQLRQLWQTHHPATGGRAFRPLPVLLCPIEELIPELNA